MPRQSRASGEFQHVIVRGNGKQVLFEDDIDRSYYLYLLKRYRDETHITLLAYCLMENHVHLLLRDEEMELPMFMKKTGVSYAWYYNKRYERMGHLFQDRYKSELIRNDSYLLSVYRYILKNPEKAGVCPAKEYQWNSYSDYGKKGMLTDTTLLEPLIGSKADLAAYLAEDDRGEFMEDSVVKHDDEWALSVIREMLGGGSGTQLQQMPKAERDEILVELKQKGITVRQLERLTGINRGVIQKAKR